MRYVIALLLLCASAVPLGFAIAGGAALAQGVDKKTERTWKAKCASCHGEDGKGQTDQGKKMAVSDMTSPEWQKKFTDPQIRQTIEGGVKREKSGIKQEMDPFKDKLAADQIDALIAYVRAFAAK